MRSCSRIRCLRICRRSQNRSEENPVENRTIGQRSAPCRLPEADRRRSRIGFGKSQKRGMSPFRASPRLHLVPSSSVTRKTQFSHVRLGFAKKLYNGLNFLTIPSWPFHKYPFISGKPSLFPRRALSPLTSHRPLQMDFEDLMPHLLPPAHTSGISSSLETTLPPRHCQRRTSLQHAATVLQAPLPSGRHRRLTDRCRALNGLGRPQYRLRPQSIFLTSRVASAP